MRGWGEELGGVVVCFIVLERRFHGFPNVGRAMAAINGAIEVVTRAVRRGKASAGVHYPYMVQLAHRAPGGLGGAVHGQTAAMGIDGRPWTVARLVSLLGWSVD